MKPPKPIGSRKMGATPFGVPPQGTGSDERPDPYMKRGRHRTFRPKADNVARALSQPKLKKGHS